MKTRFNKIVTLITAVTFASALTLNIQASLSDPFAGMSDEALAQTTTDIETTMVLNPPWEKHCHPDISGRCTWRLISATKYCESDYQCL